MSVSVRTMLVRKITQERVHGSPPNLVGGGGGVNLLSEFNFQARRFVSPSDTVFLIIIIIIIAIACCLQEFW